MQCIVVKSDEFENSSPLIYFLEILIMLLLAPFGRSAAININEIPNLFTSIIFCCERRDLLSSHSKGDLFMCEGNMLFSHVKI